MNFKELREANLSKAQIKKVHDKADDLPKNDFIKRYGKDGDSVRFATATKMVKKELGIDESIIGVNKKSVEYKNGRAAAEKGVKYDKNPHAPGTKRLNWSMGHNDFRADTLRKAGKPNYGARGQFEDYEEGFKSDAQRKAAFASGYKEKGKNKKEELDDKDKETIKPIIKQLQKSVKAHDKQAKQLQKDIQDEVELTEGRVMIAVDKKTRKKWQFSDGMIVKHNGKQYKTEGVTTQQVLELTASFGTLKLGKKDIEAGFAKGNFSVVDDGSVYQPWKNDFEPEGEKELTEAVSDAYVKQIARMTDRNDHFGARFELARLMKDKQLMGFYDSLEKMHTTLPRGVIGNDAITIRQRLERLLRDRLKSKLKADADKLIDAL